MFFGLIAIAAVIALFVIISRQQTRLGLIERELGALRSLVLSGIPQPAPRPGEVAEAAAGEATAVIAAAAAPSAGEAAPQATAAATPDEPKAEAPAQAGEGSPSEPAGEGQLTQPAAPAEAAVPARAARDVETALGTRWAVWVGGIALALGGLFLIRYTIEAGIFGPGVRLTMAGVLGLVLLAGAEFIRRTGFRVPVQGAAGAYIPAILTGAGAFILFGTVYAAYGIYGFIGPALAFTLLGAIGVATIAVSLVHGLALAGIGLIGAMVTPIAPSSVKASAGPIKPPRRLSPASAIGRRLWRQPLPAPASGPSST
ncbi:DUF2339 domain-containing protein [Mesorhizobium sp.]|uniref:DUF2339 domain-containing protein n=1 Tax=Mesorhizobium sp. TaxID=1871066 RepID=UPI00344720C5